MNALNSAQTLHLMVVKEVGRHTSPARQFYQLPGDGAKPGFDISYLMLNHKFIVPYTFAK